MAAGVFISFRPEDSAWAVRIRERLFQLLSPEHIIWDRSVLGLRADFLPVLLSHVREPEAIVVVIGKNWLARLLDDPGDAVRLEIEAAVKRSVRVIPVLVDGESTPAWEALPHSLKALGHLQALPLTREHFDSDMEQLHQQLAKAIAERRVGDPAPWFLPEWYLRDLPLGRVGPIYMNVRGNAPPFVQTRASPPSNKLLSVAEMEQLASAQRLTGSQNKDGKPVGTASELSGAVKRLTPKKNQGASKNKSAAAKKPPKKAARVHGHIQPNPSPLPDNLRGNKVSPAPAGKPPAKAPGDLVECSVFGPRRRRPAR